MFRVHKQGSLFCNLHSSIKWCWGSLGKLVRVFWCRAEDSADEGIRVSGTPQEQPS